MQFIDHQVKLLYKEVKGAITVPSIIKFLEQRGYTVVFFNTKEGDALLLTYGISPHGAKAFTYCGSTNIVFVDNNIHMSDKLYALLHECAHILLGHIGNAQIHLVDKRKTENEAEAFAYKLLNYSPYKNTHKILLSVFAAALIIAVTVFCTYAYITSTSDICVTTASSTTTSPVATSHKEVTQTVYITPSGKKFHRENCRYVKSKTVIALNRSEAENTHTSCLVCNP